jgi:hypothetical protein
MYIVCVNCAGFVILVVLVILFSVKKFKAQTNQRRSRIGRRRLAYVIYIGRANRRRLSWLTYNGPPEPS